MANRVSGASVFQEVMTNNKGGLYSISVVVDAMGNTFEAWVINDPYGVPDVQSYGYIRKVNTAGQTVADLNLICTANRKADDICIVQSGTNLEAYITGHSSGGADCSIDKYVWTGVAAPYAAGRTPLAAEGSYTPTGSTGGGGTGTGGTAVSDEDIAKIAAAVAAKFGDGGDVRQAIVDKTKQAIVESKVLTEGMFAGGSGSAIVYQQLTNTSYTGAKGAIHDAGLGK